ncbi:MAG: hypothetical protein K9K65_17315 [Desulfarculaceae bacterium]|nr:hypothetical protein [Desulfarculaceae bacterium]MCF8048874.1 hypothetical protein [Desulfarculaceae bacterium]MCF8065643.1 hypothetical protein [Desulfarculaceae bacterium]MCF8099603.1 hypothetical protein [Desulfarculaceae bacterium]
MSAQADETGCRAAITNLSGEKVTVNQFSVRLLEDAAPSTELLVFNADGQSILNLGDLRRLTRLTSFNDGKHDQKVEFAFQDDQGRTGRFKIWWDYIFSGQTPLGTWSEQAAKIKHVEISCPPPLLSPPASTQ